VITCGTQIVSGAPIYGGGGGGTLPDAPADVLLDAASPSTIVGLNASGVGEALNAASALARIGAVPTTRSVSTSSPLTGGGALSGDLTLAISVGTTAGTVAAGNDSRIVNAVPTSRTIAGLALSNNITASALNTALGTSSGLGVRTLAPDTGWTNTIGTNQPGGTASVSIAAGVHTFTGQGGGYAIETRPAISTPECPAVEWMGRFAVVTGNPTTAWYTSLSITSATDSAGYLAQVLTDQTVSLYVRAEGGSWTVVSVGPGIVSLAGNTWIRLIVTPTYAAVYWGSSASSTPPTVWNLSSSVATTVAMLAGRSLTHFGVRQGRTGAGAAVTTEWTDLQYRILGVSP
jgi:hypothetical protein